MTKIEGGITAPKGFCASGVAAQIKNRKSTRKDCAMLVSDRPCAVAGVFTTNRVKAAPVLWTRGVCARKTARALFANSGNANACTGSQGMEDARKTAERVAEGLNIDPEQVCILSTGVIGVPLPMDRIFNGVDASLAALSPTGSADAARAIMTTDTVPKEMALEVVLDGGTVRLGVIAKGAGMISPNVATMLCIITTDAAIDPEVLHGLLQGCAEATFNRICIDNDMSTNDTVLCLANGASGLPMLKPGTSNYAKFARALHEICMNTAQALVRDGEGATKFVEIRVEGARTETEATKIAKSIAASQLCKTAFFGQDPNWGRIACAAGYAGVDLNPDHLCIRVGDVEVVHNGLPTDYNESDAAAHMQLKDILIQVSVGEGPGQSVFWTSDLSHDYVTINADYRT
ncbi:MAG TPA: bifunctional glutamate N-acetyltransferase/amino-acid acetyltransferase ArgJ [Candidatus Hydrogenedentes bacterium]|nr:bifunctional glutamate N-acetyltransferase/amino-acid acetyltransferase ArgJ [Candidatus Hydrogenedentota bacterium]